MAIVLLPLLKSYCNGGVNTHHPDLTGKVVIITGANAGIGYSSTLEILKLKPKTVILACRNRQKAEKAIKQIKLATNNSNITTIMFKLLDLNDMRIVKDFAI